jgi:S-adenosylmethionine synthetase
VTEGHPDKVADQISDAILDAIISEDRRGRVACETLVTTGMVLIAGEITTSASINYADVARQTIEDIGYTDPSLGFDSKTCAVLVSIDRQSPDIAQGVDEGKGLFKEQGAGDQGVMFGYACSDTPVFMPLPIYLAHKLTRRLAECRKSGEIGFLKPDGKSQVTVRYRGDTPTAIDTVIVSTQHSPDVEYEEICEVVKEKIIRPVMPKELYDENEVKIFINPTGRFVYGGPHADCGLTGRKIIADTYGGMGSHGGGAFSGKDPSKVDRSASYMARYIAKNIVASGAAKKCEVQLAYAIGYPEPVSVLVDCFGTATVDPIKIYDAVREIFPLKPAGIIKHLDLLRPIYRKTAVYGHFGREESEFTWERLDKVDALKNYLGL